MKGWVLDEQEKEVSDWLLTFFTYEDLDCWDLKAPDGYVSEFEKGVMNPEDKNEAIT